MPTNEFAERTDFTDAEKLALIDRTIDEVDADSEPVPCPRCAAPDGHVDRLGPFLACWVRSVWPFSAVLLVAIGGGELVWLAAHWLGGPDWAGYIAAFLTALPIGTVADRLVDRIKSWRN